MINVKLNGYNFKIDKLRNAQNGKVKIVNGNHIYTPNKANTYEELEMDITLEKGNIKFKQTLILGFGIQEERAKDKSLINIDYFVVDYVANDSISNSNLSTVTNWKLTLIIIGALLLAMAALFVYLLVFRVNNN